MLTKLICIFIFHLSLFLSLFSSPKGTVISLGFVQRQLHSSNSMACSFGSGAGCGGSSSSISGPAYFAYLGSCPICPTNVVAATQPPSSPHLLRRGLLHLLPGAVRPFTRTGARLFLFRVLAGTVRYEFGDGLTLPHHVGARFGNTFIVRPFNFFCICNAASGSAWAVLF